jgi:3'-phosphoadenosine 5'-phosphosulfate sulfotransferase (PAPS reductase)/FAD synthetase
MSAKQPPLFHPSGKVYDGSYIPEGASWKERIRNAMEADVDLQIVIGISAGKDSSAVAILFQEEFPELLERVHFIFADTGSELPETYAYLDKLSVYLGQKVKHLISKVGTLDEIIKEKFGNYLPSPMSRYCTRMSKINPFRDYMDDLCETADVVFNLVGIRADEPTRTGYEPCGQYAHKVFTYMPLQDEGMDVNDVFDLVENRVGLPEYYRWRTRSGCYYCFYQRRIEWVNLLENHPDLFEKAKEFEKTDPETGKKYTWIQNMSLDELAEKAEDIKARYYKRLGRKKEKGDKFTMTDGRIFESLMKELEPENAASCSVCR